MSTVNSKMTAIADEIRTLTNTTEAMGLDAMATNIETANTATTTQESLISQIQTALIGKAAGGSGSGGIETVTGTIILDSPPAGFYVDYIDAVGNHQKQIITGEHTITCAKGFIYVNTSIDIHTGGIEFLEGKMGMRIYYVTDNFSLTIKG